MIHETVEFSNCAEIRRFGGYVTPQRVPESVRVKLNEAAQRRMLQPACGEIRFALPPGESARLILSSDSETRVVVYFGDYRHSEVTYLGCEPQTITIEWNARFLKGLAQVREKPHTFDPGVVRVLMSGSAVRLHRIEGKGLRPPRHDELPALRYLAYGTSITQESYAIAPHLSYAARTARLLGADLLNFGMGGACHCEPVLADYFASRTDWDFGTLALSVNMLGFEHEEFGKRVRYMVHTVAESSPSRPVACMTIAPYYGDLFAERGHHPPKVETFRQILRDAVADCPTANVHLIEGSDLLRSHAGLTTDLLHPSDDGMIETGANLASRLKEIRNRSRGSIAAEYG